MHVDKNSGINQNQDKIDLQQPLVQKQQASVFGNGFPDKNNNGIVDKSDFDDDLIIEQLKNKNLLNCFWGDVYKKVNDIVHFSDKKIKVETDTSYEIKRTDGYKIKIVAVNGSNPVLQIQGKDKLVVNISISFANMNNNGELLNNVSEEDKNVRMQLLVDALKELKTNVLKDLSQEINEIQLNDKSYRSSTWAEYYDGVMAIALKADYGEEKLSDTITHEIGHAVDQEPEGGFSTALLDDNWNSYVYIFDEYKCLLQNIMKKYNDKNDTNTYSLKEWREDFACRYERMEGDSNSEMVVDIEKLINKFKNSDNNEEQYCYELHKKLDDLTQKIIEGKRQLPREQRVRDFNK